MNGKMLKKFLQTCIKKISVTRHVPSTDFFLIFCTIWKFENILLLFNFTLFQNRQNKIILIMHAKNLENLEKYNLQRVLVFY